MSVHVSMRKLCLVLQKRKINREHEGFFIREQCFHGLISFDVSLLIQ